MNTNDVIILSRIIILIDSPLLNKLLYSNESNIEFITNV